MNSKRRRAVQAARLTASAFAASAVVAVAAGTAAADDSRGQSDGSSASQARLKEPKVKLKDGRLEIEGKKAEDDRIALFLKPGDPGTLQVDVDGDGTADESVPRAEITSISVDPGRGDDIVRIDESNGLFTDTIPTTAEYFYETRLRFGWTPLYLKGMVNPHMEVLPRGMLSARKLP